MLSIHIHEAKAKLPECLAAVEAGETAQICRRSVPVAQIVPLPPARTIARPIGLACDRKDAIPASFLEPLPDALPKAFSGNLPVPLLDNIDNTSKLQAAQPDTLCKNAC